MSDEKLNPRMSVRAMVTIALVLSKFAPASGQMTDYPAGKQRERF